jgi:hypothetical protein
VGNSLDTTISKIGVDQSEWCYRVKTQYPLQNRASLQKPVICQSILGQIDDEIKSKGSVVSNCP